ncbi:MAG: hypothetical protein M3R15_01330 [Acidobacteriota bacterium]|nr:hypothetical protein [Acidobacteriota bacterium]
MLPPVAAAMIEDDARLISLIQSSLTRRGELALRYRELKPTAKVLRSLTRLKNSERFR